MPFFETDDNTRLFYQDWNTGKPVVFLHAWAMNSDMWEYHMLYFKEHQMRCIAYDRRGHGRSDRSDRGYHYDQYADDLNALLAHLDLIDVTLVGHSMGCGEIIRYLSRHGQSRVGRIVLIAPCAPYLLKTENNPDGIDMNMFEATREAIRKDFPKWLTDNAHAFYLPDTWEVSADIVRWTFNMILQTSLKAAIDGTHQFAETDFRNELRSIKVPALIIHGSADASVPVHFGRWAAQLIPVCQYKEYEGAPHGIFFTHMKPLNADIWAFVNT